MRVEIANLYHKLDSTFIYVTHDQVEAMTLGTRIVVMKDGVIQQIDTPDNLFLNPANKFVASFIGTPPMNFLEGMVEMLGEEANVHIRLLKQNKLIISRTVSKQRYKVGIRFLEEHIHLFDTQTGKTITN